MKLAVVAGGWHFPLHFYRKLAYQTHGCELFVVAHRDPDLPIVREEKAEALRHAPGHLGSLDRELYARYASWDDLRSLGWNCSEAPNRCGDWCYLNQWLETHDYHRYDAILSCHDDNFVRRYDVFEQLTGRDWLVLANCGCPSEPPGYLRGSFEFFKPDLLDLLGGHIDLGEVALTREGKTDSPAHVNDLIPWNATNVPLRQFMVERGLADRIERFSPYYRVSPWVIEGERGFLHLQQLGPPWTLNEGLEHYPV